MSSNRRNLVIVVAAVAVALIALVVLGTRNPSPSGPGPSATCAGDLGPGTPSAACAGPSDEPSGSVAPSGEPSEGASDEPSQEPVALTVGLGFIPSVQFAPFYLADQAGYYEEAGLDVTFQNKIDPDLIAARRPGLGRCRPRGRHERHPGGQPGHPDQVRGHDLRPVPLDRVREGVDRASRTAADLAGKKVGIPGRYGSSWIMLQALLADRRTSRPTTSRSSSTPTSARERRSPRARWMPRPGSPTTSRSSSS